MHEKLRLSPLWQNWNFDMQLRTVLLISSRVGTSLPSHPDSFTLRCKELVRLLWIWQQFQQVGKEIQPVRENENLTKVTRLVWTEDIKNGMQETRNAYEWLLLVFWCKKKSWSKDRQSERDTNVCQTDWAACKRSKPKENDFDCQWNKHKNK